MIVDQELITTKRRVGLKDVASAAQVSVATASMAMSDHPRVNEETKRRVRRLGSEMGYRPKDLRVNDQAIKGERAAKRRLRRVGFMVLGTEIQNVFNASILQTLLMKSNEHDIAIQVAAIDRPEDLGTAPARISALAGDVDGLILMGWITPEVVALLDRTEVPYVVLGHAMGASPRLHSICFDEMTMGMVATASLIGAGHRQIAFLGEVMPVGLYYWRWRTGYAAALLDAQIAVDPQMICMCGKNVETGERLADMVLGLAQRPTGYLIPNARTAVQFVEAMRRRGIEIPIESVVIAADSVVLKHTGAQAYPYIDCQHTLLASMGLSQLIRVVEEAGLPGSTIHVPFVARNLPKPI